MALRDDVQAVAQIAFAEDSRASLEARLFEHGADLSQHLVGGALKDADRAQHVEPLDRHYAHRRIHREAQRGPSTQHGERLLKDCP